MKFREGAPNGSEGIGVLETTGMKTRGQTHKALRRLCFLLMNGRQLEKEVVLRELKGERSHVL